MLNNDSRISSSKTKPVFFSLRMEIINPKRKPNTVPTTIINGTFGATGLLSIVGLVINSHGSSNLACCN